MTNQNGKPAAVVFSPEEFDNMKYTERFINSVNQGLSDINSGYFSGTEEVKSELKKLRSVRRPV
ncbi:MAG: hypothetical protein JW956_02405 [Calditrichaceae bacterium]|nr:hypothetical protein [Calditrichaceae bacterium]